MNYEEFKKAIEQGEGLRIEFKESKNTIPASFFESVSSFANTDGGTIFLGVSDNGDIVGIDSLLKNKLQKDIVTALNSRDCMNPPIYVQPFFIKYPKGEIMVIQIPSSSQIHNYAGRVYYREFEADIDVTDNQHKISELYLRKRNFFTESVIYPHLNIDNLDPELFDRARLLIRNYRSDHPWLMVNNEQLLRDSVLWRKDFLTGKEGLTLAAALIFGRDSTIQNILPAYKVEAMVRIQNKDRWDDRINPPLRTNLIDTYLELKAFINKHLPEKFYLESDQRIDLRDKIFREVIGNAIIHREYTSAHSTDLIISRNSVIITNPNKPLFHGPIDPNGFNPFPKNPNIRKFFTAFGWADEIGSGIRNTFKYLPEYTNGAIPLFLENDLFKTEIPLQQVSMAIYANEWQKWLDLPDIAYKHIHKGLSNISLDSSLSNTEWSNLILFLVPSWHKKGIQLTYLNWPVNQKFTKDDIEKVSGWQEKGTLLLAKKAWYLITILILASEPISLSELMNFINYKNAKSFRDNYIIPLRKTGFITLTNLEMLTDPGNKYTITEAGKLFLGGRMQTK